MSHSKLMPRGYHWAMIELRDAALFRGLKEAEVEKLKPYFVEKTCQYGELLFSENDRCRNFFIVRKGSVKLYWTDAQGHRERILQMLHPGDTCLCHPGFETGCNVSAEAGRDTVLWKSSLDHLRRILEEYPAVAQAAASIFAQKARAYSNLVQGLAVRNSRQRVIDHLLALADAKGLATGEGTLIELPGTRQHVASQIGTSRENFQRCLLELKKAGLIQVRRKQIVIRQKDALRHFLTASEN
ncbi:MAG: Crp/Fnr family transcriptional regulator [Candidatus Omnitrophica bacterium]|nr:Crp/Fnr family transcriptional regulator [Candidatus Omnitrophota bacterium]